MTRRRDTLCLLALATLSVGSTMAASPRDPPEYYVSPPPETSAERRSRRVTEMAAALGRLVGKFGIERPWVFSEPPLPPNAPRTMWDCARIGEGVGVHCVILTVWSQAVRAEPAGAGKMPQAPNQRPPARAPSRASRVIEYGIDPNASRVRLMRVDGGSAIRMDGWVSGTTLTMEGICWNQPACRIGQRMTASADREDIWVTDYRIESDGYKIDSEGWHSTGRYALRRLTQEEVDAADWNVEGARPTFPTKPSRPR